MSVPTKPQVRAGNLWNTYVRAWAHGTAVKPLDPKFTGHTNAEIREAYTDGYKAGRDARNIVAQEAAARYGYEPSILRLADAETGFTVARRCGVEGCRLPPEHEGLHAFGNNIP